MSHSYLKGKRVLITRPEKDSGEFSALLAGQGAEPAVIPLVGFIGRELPEEEMRKLRSASEYDWIIFTSKNGVRFFFKQVDEGTRLPNIASIGDKTTESIKKRGFEPKFVPGEFVAEAFVEEFIPRLTAGSKILLVKGSLARDLISTELENHGHRCDEIILYETVLPDGSADLLKEALESEKLDIITFASSSAVHHFMRIVHAYKLERKLDRCLFACIGPVAKKTAEAYGLTVPVCGNPYTMEGLFHSLSEYGT